MLSILVVLDCLAALGVFQEGALRTPLEDFC